MRLTGNGFVARVLALATVLLLSTGLLVTQATIAAPRAAAQNQPVLPPGFALRDLGGGQGVNNLTDFAYLPNDGGILTIGKQGDVVWIPPAGQSSELHDLDVDDQQDLGLVGLAVAPDYATSRTIYLAWSLPRPEGQPTTVRLARWTVTGEAAPTGLTGQRPLLEVPVDKDVVVHGMTGIVAADDGTLWVSIGDLTPHTLIDRRALRAPDPDYPQGKILHLTADGAGVPSNPFYDAASPGSTRSKVFASGFRSPFRFSLDARTGLPVVGDVGNERWEELDIVQPGRSYGWPCWEGRERTPGYRDLGECAGGPLAQNTDPLAVFAHGDGGRQARSVTGGIRYTGESYPAKYRGAYFFGDYGGKPPKLWSLRFDTQGTLVEPPGDPLGTSIGSPVKFAAAPNGDIVFADIASGKLRRLTYNAGNQPPVATATSSTDPATRTVTFDASGSYDPDGHQLRYDWNFGDGTTGSGVRATHTYPASAERFTATLTVSDSLGAGTSTEITVVPANHSPDVELVTPGENATFAVGAPVRLSATATDEEDGTLPVKWTSTVLHCSDGIGCHDHPGPAGDGPAFESPFTDHHDSRMRFTATVTDSDGVSASRTYVAMPREHRLTLSSNVPAGLTIPSEGDVSTAMVAEGATISVSAAATATDGVSTFAGWADGTAERVRNVTIGASDLTLEAHYATPVTQRYDAEPGLRETLGAPDGAEVIDGGVYYRAYENGRLYWSAQTGTREVHGPIADAYVALGGHAKFGPPSSDQRVTPDGVGRYNHFVGTPATLAASVYWTPDTGAHAVWGLIRERWRALGWERGPLGYPTTDETPTADGVGRYNHFSKAGSIYWSSATGAHAVWGAIRERWRALGSEQSPLGYPTTDEKTTPDGVGRYNHFSKAGSIYWSPRTGAHEVYGAIRVRWRSLGWERSYLGYPTSGEYSVSGGRRNNFQHGYIRWYSATGNVIDRRY